MNVRVNVRLSSLSSLLRLNRIPPNINNSSFEVQMTDSLNKFDAVQHCNS